MKNFTFSKNVVVTPFLLTAYRMTSIIFALMLRMYFYYNNLDYNYYYYHFYYHKFVIFRRKKKLFVSTNPTDPIFCANPKLFFSVCLRF